MNVLIGGIVSLKVIKDMDLIKKIIGELPNSIDYLKRIFEIKKSFLSPEQYRSF